MSTKAANTPAPTARVSPALLGMILFIGSEVMFFGGLFAAYFSLRASHEVWPPAGSPAPGVILPALMTVALVASSMTQHRAVSGKDAGIAGRWTAITIGLGAIFLAGQAFEWRQLSTEGLGVDSDPFGTSFFTLTGAHGLHVIVGLGMLIATRLRLRSGFDAPRRRTLEAATYYWHFVDVVWIGVFTLVYVVT